VITALAVACFGLAGLCGAYRLVIGPTLADRVIALDVTLVALMGAIAVDAAHRRDPTNLVIVVVLAIIGFTGTVAASRFLESDLGADETAHRGGTGFGGEVDPAGPGGRR
jgi:multicomponent Na+:H+ antiporter subunit F